MDLFNRDKIDSLKTELNLTKAEYTDFIIKTNNTFDELDRMISREKGTSETYETLIQDYYKIGDPYLHNIFVRKAIDKIAANISGVKFDVVNQNDIALSETTREQKLFRYINDDDSSTDFIYEIVRSLQRFGKAFIVQYPIDSEGFPVMLDILPADKIKYKDGAWEYKDKKKTLRIDKNRVIFVRYKHPEDPYDGLAPGTSAVKEILMDFYSQVYNIKNFRRGAQGKGVWVDPSGKPLTAQQKLEAQRSVDNEFNRGVDGAGASSVLSRRLEWIRTSESNRDMEYQALANKMRDDILIAYDIPKVLFASAESTFTNLKEAKTMFWSMTLQPIMDLIEESFNTNFFAAKGLNYKLRFRVEDISELQDDYDGKIDQAIKLYQMNVPMSIINEVVGLELPGWEGWDQPQTQSFQFDHKPEETKSTIDIIKEYDKQRLIDQEKQINIDEFARHIEYEKSLNTMLQYEKELYKKVEGFFRLKYKDVEDFIESNPIKSVNKSVDPSWLDAFKAFLLKQRWGDEFFLSVKDTIERVFHRGRYRTYSGLGLDFSQDPERAIAFIANRGLKLKDSPDVLKDTIITMLESESFTTDDLAKAISSKWKDATIGRAKVIAQTETTAAFSGGRVEGMKELGIKQKQWLHSRDGKVRDSHRIDQIVPVDEDFTLGDGVKVAYPGDGDPAHSANCRCTVVSVL